MKRLFLGLCLLSASIVMAETEPLFYESFDKCIDDEGENYGYTGGNDGQWGGNVGTAIVIYEDNEDWTYNYANGAYQCVKVGTSKYQGWIKTPQIPCSGDVTLTFRAAPWEGDSIFTVSVSGGTADKTYFELKKNQWNDLTVNISDITSGIKVTFSSLYKHRFFLDEVKITPATPGTPAIRVPDGKTVDFGFVGKYYTSQSRSIEVIGENLTGNITTTLEDGENDLFAVSPSILPAAGGQLTITLKEGASAGDIHGTYLKLRGKDASDNTIEKAIMLMVEVGNIDLEGSGTKDDPYTIADRILLANNDGTVWEGTYYWVTGYVLGAVKRYNDTFDGVCDNDNTSLVLAATPDETNWNKIVTVQIGQDARAALNVIDNPELIGQQIKVQGILVYGSNATPLYLGKPGVRDVNNNDQYVRPAKDATAIEHTEYDMNMPAYDLLGRQVDESYHGIVIQGGKKWLR